MITFKGLWIFDEDNDITRFNQFRVSSICGYIPMHNKRDTTKRTL